MRKTVLSLFVLALLLLPAQFGAGGMTEEAGKGDHGGIMSMNR